MQTDPNRLFYNAPTKLCADTVGTNPINLTAGIKVEKVMAYHVRLQPGSYQVSEFINVMEWPFDRYTIHISENMNTVRFHNEDPDDAGNFAYLRGSEYPEFRIDLGWWVGMALRAWQHGVEEFLTVLRDERASHLNTEPPCPYSAKRRRQRVGGIDHLESR